MDNVKQIDLYLRYQSWNLVVIERRADRLVHPLDVVAAQVSNMRTRGANRATLAEEQRRLRRLAREQMRANRSAAEQKRAARRRHASIRRARR